MLKLFPQLLIICVCLFPLSTHGETFSLMFGMNGEKKPVENTGKQKNERKGQYSSNKSNMGEQEARERAISQDATDRIRLQEDYAKREGFSIPTNEAVKEQMERFYQVASLAQRYSEFEKGSNARLAISALQHTIKYLNKMNTKTAEPEKLAWGELAAYSFQEANAHADGEKEKAQAYARGISALEDVVRCLHYSGQVASQRVQEILKQEALYHHQRAIEEVNGNEAEAQKLYLIAVAMRNASNHFQNVPLVEVARESLRLEQQSLEQRAEILAGECSIQEAQMREQEREEEMQNRKDAVLAAEQAIQYCRQADKTINLPEKRALAKAAQSSFQRSQALLADEREHAAHFLWAFFHEGDAARYFQQADKEINPEKKADCFSKAQYYLQHADLWKHHQVEQANKFSYKKFQTSRTFLPVEPVVPSKNPPYSQIDPRDEQK